MKYVKNIFLSLDDHEQKTITSLTREGSLKKFLISSFAALLIMLALPVAGIFAASATPQVQKHNCVVQLLPVRAGQTSSEVVKSACFETFSQAVVFATNGAVHLSAAATPKDFTAVQMKSASVRPSACTSSCIIGTLWDLSSYSGTSLTVTSLSGASCTGYATYKIADLNNDSWDNAVTSLQTSTSTLSCGETHLYTNTTYKGLNECYTGDSTYVGDAMNNQASSVSWSVSGTSGDPNC